MKWIALVGVVAAVFVAWLFLPVREWMTALNDWIAGLGPFGWVVFALVYAAATVAAAPGSVFTIAAGLLFGLAGFFVVVPGATLGAALAFLIARYLARGSVERRFGGNRRFRAVDGAIEEEGWKIVGLLRLSPLIPFNLQNYLYGLTKVGFLPYVLATFFGIMPGTLLYVYLGAAGRAALSGGAPGEDGGALRWVFFAAGLAATVAVTVIVTRAARRKLDQIGVEDELEAAPAQQ